MPSDISINEAVDNLIKTHETETKKRKSLFFRMFSEHKTQTPDKEEDQEAFFTVMEVPIEAKTVDGTSCVAGLGDNETIERVIKRHEMIRKSKLEVKNQL